MQRLCSSINVKDGRRKRVVYPFKRRVSDVAWGYSLHKNREEEAEEEEDDASSSPHL